MSDYTYLRVDNQEHARIIDYTIKTIDKIGIIVYNGLIS